MGWVLIDDGRLWGSSRRLGHRRVCVKTNFKPCPAAASGRKPVEGHLGLPLHIFRLSGIYGPNRTVLDSIRAGTAQRIDKPDHVFSRIHVDDIVRVLRASMAAPCPGEIYNLADDEPASSSDVIAYGCSLLGVAPLPLIPFAEASLSPMMREFYADHRRVDNSKMKKYFGIDLKYPTYREGLKNC